MATAGFRKKPIPTNDIAKALDATASVVLPGDSDRAKNQNAQPLFEAVSPQKTVAIAEHAAFDSSYEIGKVYDIPLRLISSNPMNPRAIYGSDDVALMAASIAERGQQISATGYIDPVAGVVLIEGETRFRACRDAKIPTLRVEIKEKPESDLALYEQARSANVERKNQTSLDDAIVWKQLLSKKIYPNQRALAHALNVEEDVVSRVLSLNNFPPKIFSFVSQTPEVQNLRMLVALREYSNDHTDDETIELISEVVRNGLGSREVASRQKASTKAPVRKPRSDKEEVKFRHGQGHIRSFDKDGRVELSIKGLAPDEVEEFTTKLRAIFNGHAA